MKVTNDQSYNTILYDLSDLFAISHGVCIFEFSSFIIILQLVCLLSSFFFVHLPFVIFVFLATQTDLVLSVLLHAVRVGCNAKQRFITILLL